MGPWHGCVAGSWMWIFPVIGLCILVIFVFLLFRLVGGGKRTCLPGDISGSATTPGDSAVEILRRRYANGEIDKEEYERIKRDIS